MTIAPPVACRNPTCGKASNDGAYCDECKPERNREAAARRGSRSAEAQKLYDYRWAKIAKAYIWDNPFCAQCGWIERLECDHIVPHGGDRDLFKDPDNLQTLCSTCHRRKTATEDGGFGNVVKTKVYLVCGPPGSGKTTYVSEHSIPGDLIVDLDAIQVALNGGAPYEGAQGVLPYALGVKAHLIAQIPKTQGVRAAWVIAGGATAGERDAIAKPLGAKAIVLAVEAHECLQRIAKDDRRSRMVDEWKPIIMKWWHDFEADRVENK